MLHGIKRRQRGERSLRFEQILLRVMRQHSCVNSGAVAVGNELRLLFEPLPERGHRRESRENGETRQIQLVQMLSRCLVESDTQLFLLLLRIIVTSACQRVSDCVNQRFSEIQARQCGRLGAHNRIENCVCWLLERVQIRVTLQQRCHLLHQSINQRRFNEHQRRLQLSMKQSKTNFSLTVKSRFCCIFIFNMMNCFRSST
mmetsp:Transcript_13489/g.23314  ORF Transcript_13489/g.23314 Transcript_13489/m.23314 type:complete len:201 (+) Transcript_13489:262-864(+)